MGRLCEELAGFFRNLMLIKTMKDASGLVNAVGEELEAMTKTALSMELSTILHALDDVPGSRAVAHEDYE